MPDDNKRFCTTPFRHFEILGDGAVAPCCSLWTDVRLGNVFSQSVEEIWNSPQAQSFRRSILDDSFSQCHHARCRHLVNGTLPQRKDIADPALRAVIDQGQTALDFGPRHVSLAHDPRCNLSCPSCRSGYCRLTDGAEKMLSSVADNVVFPILRSKSLESIVIAGHGDPWATPHYRSILRELADHDCGNVNVIIATNALLMDEKQWNSYKGLERYRPHVCVSVDAIWPWTYERLRRPGKWERLAGNLRFLSRIRKEGKLRRFEINMTVQADNYQQMHLFLEMGRHLGCDAVKFYMIQNTGPHLAATYADANIGNPAHPEFQAFLEVLRNPVFDDEICEFYDINSIKEFARRGDGIDLGHAETFLAAEAAMNNDDPGRALAIVTARLQKQQSSILWYLAAQALKLLGSDRRAADCWKAAARSMTMEAGDAQQ